MLLLSFLHATFFFCVHNILYYYSVVLDFNKAFEIFQEHKCTMKNGFGCTIIS